MLPVFKIFTKQKMQTPALIAISISLGLTNKAKQRSYLQLLKQNQAAVPGRTL